MVKTAAFLALIIFVVAHTSAENWKKIPLEGGSIQQLLPDRSHPGVWFVINSGSLYRSTDAGVNWKQAKIKNVQQVLIHSATNDVFVVLAGRAPKMQIWRSSDNGKTFQLQVNVHGYLRKLFVHPDHPEIVYAFGIGNDDLAVSHDGGRNWTPFDFTDPQQLGCDGDCFYSWNDLLISPTNHDTIFLSGGIKEGDPSTTAVPLLLTSTNSGNSWSFEQKPVFTFYMDPAFPDRAYAFNNQLLVRLISGHWETPIKFGVLELASVPEKPSWLFALHRTKNGEFLGRSHDGGHSWSYLFNDLDHSATHLAAQNSNLLLAGTDGGGVFRRIDINKPWQHSSTGFKDVSLSSTTVSGADVYALASSGRWLFRSTKEVHSAPFLTEVHADPKNPLHLIGIRSDDRIEFSRSGGVQWNYPFKLPKDYYYAVAFDPNIPETVYLAGSIDPVLLYRSTNGGQRFVVTSAKFPGAVYHINDIVVDKNNSQVVYFLTTDGVYKSTDAGSTVRKANSGVSCARCPAEPYSMVPQLQKDFYLLAMTDGGLFSTNNAATSWTKVGTIPGFFISQMVSANPDGTHLFVISENANTFNPEVLESTNGGKTWTNISNQIGPSLYFRNLSSTFGLPVYVATDRGLFRSP